MLDDEAKTSDFKLNVSREVEQTILYGKWFRTDTSLIQKNHSLLNTKELENLPSVPRQSIQNGTSEILVKYTISEEI